MLVGKPDGKQIGQEKLQKSKKKKKNYLLVIAVLDRSKSFICCIVRFCRGNIFRTFLFLFLLFSIVKNFFDARAETEKH